VIAVFAVLCAMAMNGCESSVRATSLQPADVTASSPVPLLCDARSEPLRIATVAA